MNKIKLYATIAISAIAIIAIGTFLLTAGRIVGQFFFGRGFAEAQLRDYVTKVFKDEVNGVNCQAMDTDQNGYVSCDFTVKSQPTSPISVECAGWGFDGFMNRGCKERIPGSFRPR
jgi:hypothetical protein